MAVGLGWQRARPPLGPRNAFFRYAQLRLNQAVPGAQTGAKGGYVTLILKPGD